MNHSPIATIKERLDVQGPSKRSYSSFNLTRVLLAKVKNVIDEEDVKEESDEEEVKQHYKTKEKLDPYVEKLLDSPQRTMSIGDSSVSKASAFIRFEKP